MKQNIPSKITPEQAKVIAELKKKGYIVPNKKKDIVSDDDIVLRNAKEEIYVNPNGDII